MKLNVGMHIESTDGRVGEVADVVIDPVKLQVTHLVVQPHHHHERARLVPIGALSSCNDTITLSWSSAQVDDAPVVEQTDFIQVGAGPQLHGRWDVGANTMLAWPYYPYGGVVAGHGFSGYPYGYGVGAGSHSGSVVKMTYDRVPQGTVEVRRASKVISSDDHVIGHVDGFVIGASDAITHLVLERGHLWGHRDVTIPVSDVAHADTEAVHLSVTRDAVGTYASVPFRRHEHAA